MKVYLEPSHKKGFTLVELLIVIVVIAILAAISVVAYNGIQKRAKDTQTINAVSQWATALKAYRIDHGEYPSMTSCLGSGYTSGHLGNETTPRQCRQDNATAGLNVNSAFMSAMSEYVKGDGPNPAHQTVTTGGGVPWYRGAYFYAAYSNVPARIDFVLTNTTTCPQVNGLDVRSAQQMSGGIRCNAYFYDG